MKIHFLSFASGKFKKGLKRIEIEARNSVFFDTINCLCPGDLPTKYRIENLLLLNSFTRGYGYWIWKSFVIKLLLEKVDDGDVILYADAGSMINIEGKKRFNEYVELLCQSRYSNLSFQTVHSEKKYNKSDVFEYFNVLNNDIIKDSGQLYGGVFMVKKDSNSIALVNEWYSICHNHKKMISDEASQIANDAEFIDHRHDQSIFSVLRKLRGSEIIKDELFFLNWDENKKFPIHTRTLR